MDQARVIATILEHPVAHRGKTYQLYGPKEYTFPEAFGRIAQILERPIEYEWIPLDVYYEELMQWGRPFFAQHIIEVAKDQAAGVFSGTNDVFDHITRQKPIGLEEFIRQHRAAFA